MIVGIFISIIFFCELSEKNHDVLAENKPKIVRTLTIFVPGDPKICKYTIGKETSVKLSEDLLPPIKKEKKSNPSSQTSNSKVNSFYMTIKSIWFLFKKL